MFRLRLMPSCTCMDGLANCLWDMSFPLCSPFSFFVCALRSAGATTIFFNGVALSYLLYYMVIYIYNEVVKLLRSFPNTLLCHTLALCT